MHSYIYAWLIIYEILPVLFTSAVAKSSNEYISFFEKWAWSIR